MYIVNQTKNKSKCTGSSCKSTKRRCVPADLYGCMGVPEIPQESRSEAAYGSDRVQGTVRRAGSTGKGICAESKWCEPDLIQRTADCNYEEIFIRRKW